jgi:general secretion pathway protein K
MPIVATLWSLTLLGAISISLAFTGNIAYRLAQNSFHVAYDDALADAAVNRAVLALLDPRTDSRRLMNAVDQKFDLGGASIHIRIQDELGKIDLDQTDGSTLVKLFQSVGVDPMVAEALVDKVLDWRDDSPFKRVDGAKADEYRAAGYDYLPRNGPFQSVDELTLVMGMTRDLYRRVEPALTVYSGRQFVEPQFATPEVLAALPSLADAHAAAASQSGASATAAAMSGIADNLISVLIGRAFTIDTEISRSTDVARHHTAVRLTGNPADPFWILLRQRT